MTSTAVAGRLPRCRRYPSDLNRCAVGVHVDSAAATGTRHGGTVREALAAGSG
jgi:hypothetical protein